MYRIDNSTASTTLPASTPTGTPGYWTDGDETTGTAPTIVDAEWLNMTQEELLNVIVAGGEVPNKADRSQLLKALHNLFNPAGPPDLSNYVTRAEMNAALAAYVLISSMPGYLSPYVQHAEMPGFLSPYALLSQFAYNVQAGDQLQQYFPHSFFQCGYVVVPAGFPAPIATVVNLPAPFPSWCDAVLVGLAGTSPAAGDSISGIPINNSQIELGAGAEGATELGCVYLAIGH